MKSLQEKGALLIENLLDYALANGLIEESDRIYVRNHLMALLQIEQHTALSSSSVSCQIPDFPTSILEQLLDYCWETGILEDNTLTHRDLMDTKIMGLLLARPSAIEKTFHDIKMNDGVQAATEYFYSLCQKSDYIRMERIYRNVKWEVESPYGALEVTINLTKPEKDPKEIAALKNAPSSGYPQCLLCPDNVGYPGRINHPARQTLRTLPLTLQGEPWQFQYSPYVYYNEHCIVFNEKHIPMKISRDTFIRLFDFLNHFPHYFIGSNADLPIVGGSILNHDHFQGGNYVFPMEKAAIKYPLCNEKHPDIQAFVVNWPMSVLRLRSTHSEALIKAAEEILEGWREYSDPSIELLAYSTDDTGIHIPHNTITPIARRKTDGFFELDLVLRNNRTNAAHPLGIFHPHEDLHHIKKENIGLIEVMGLFILPGRLEYELALLSDYFTGKEALDQHINKTDSQHSLAKHALWLKDLIGQFGNNLSKEEAQSVLRVAVGMKCRRVLEDAGIFKSSEEGQRAFHKFLAAQGYTE